MNPVQHGDFVGPMVTVVYALMPYVFLALMAGNNVKLGLRTVGQALGDRRPKFHAVLGLVFAALHCVLG